MRGLVFELSLSLSLVSRPPVSVSISASSVRGRIEGERPRDGLVRVEKTVCFSIIIRSLFGREPARVCEGRLHATAERLLVPLSAAEVVFYGLKISPVKHAGCRGSGWVRRRHIYLRCSSAQFTS